MKKALYIFLGFLGLLIVGYFVATAVLKNKIEKVLASQVEYKKLNLNLLAAEASLEGIKFDKENKKINSEKVKVDGVDYWAYLTKGEIHIDRIKITKPVIQFGPKKSKPQDSSTSKKSNKKVPLIKVEEFKVEDGRFSFKDDSLHEGKVSVFKIQFNKIEVDKKTLQQKIPFNYESFQITANDFEYVIGKLHNAKIKRIELDEKNLNLSDLKLIPKFTRENYTAQIPYEKDLMDIKLKNLQLTNYQFDANAEPFSFSAPKLLLDSLYVDIYRDKTIKDDTTKKSLYSKMLRELKIDLRLDSLLVERMYLNYEELIKADREPGKIFFEDMSFKASPITNVNLERSDFPDTKVEIRSQFMGKSTLNVDWQFNVSDPADKFSIKGSGFNIPKESINSFFVPAFGMKTEGQVNKLYFNFNGNSDQAYGELKIDYEDFKVEVLNKEGTKTNKFLSAIANLVVDKKTEQNESKTADVSQINRDKTKSFWNYFWKCIEAGLKETLLIF